MEAERKNDVSPILTCSSAQNEAKLLAVGCIEHIDGVFSVFIRGVSINATVLVATHNHEILQDVKHFEGRLRGTEHQQYDIENPCDSIAYHASFA